MHATVPTPPAERRAEAFRTIRRMAFITGILACSIAGSASCSDPDQGPAGPAVQDSSDNPRDTIVVQYRLIANIRDGRLAEISGMAVGRRNPGLFWMHNDSGDEPRIFAVDSTGTTIAVVSLEGAEAIDWEDMALIDLKGVPTIIVGDVGDNDVRRAAISIYRFPEPLLHPSSHDSLLTVVAERADFVYEDGARNCECLLAHPDGSIYLVEKTSNPSSGVYLSTWPAAGDPASAFVHIADLTIGSPLSILNQITAGDLRRDGRALIVRTYAAAYELALPEGTNSFSAIWSQPPSVVAMPPLPQAEALAYGEGTALYTVSEGTASPIYLVSR